MKSLAISVDVHIIDGNEDYRIFLPLIYRRHDRNKVERLCD